ncbi:MAG: YlbF family regulator [Eubacteriales bacterium]
MYIYDKANELASLIKESDEFTKYKQLKDKIYEDETTKSLVKEYKKLQFEAQASYMTGKQPENELIEKLKKVGEVLQFNNDVSEYFAAEYKLNTLIGDIYKILGDACDVSLDFMD